jgi:hypothetical protein
MDMEKLAAEAAVAAVKELAVSGVKAGLAGGGRLWGWIRGKAGGADAAVLDAVAKAPEKASATDKVSGLLKDLLDGNPDLQEELAALLTEAKADAVQQARAEGDGIVQVQVAGSGNPVTVTR